MKKTKLFVASFVFMAVFCAFSFAQEFDPLAEEPDLQTFQVITEQGKNRLTSMTIEWYPELKEARFVYTGPAPLFDQGDAMEAIRQRIIAFCGEKGYYNYSFLRKDTTHFDNKANKAIYTCFVKFE